MTLPRDTIFPLEAHSKAKHAILKRYLEAWFPILNTYHHRIVYIDGFAGPGIYSGGEPGSPIIALNAAINHRITLTGNVEFYFIDERQDRIECLNEELKKLKIPSNFFIKDPKTARFHDEIESVLASLESPQTQKPPVFVFIDPFGFSGIPFTIVDRFLRLERCESLITFQVDSINRFLNHPRESIVKDIVAAFGTEEAIRIAEASGDRIEKLRELYQNQLAKVARFVRYFRMSNKQNRPIYFLFFATNHRLGHIKMKEAMWRVDSEGEFRFSDATDPNQIVLFDMDKTSVLMRQLMARFGNHGTVRGKEVEIFVEDCTAFLKNHKTKALKELESDGKLIVDPEKLDGTKRIKNTYPEGAKMKFY